MNFVRLFSPDWELKQMQMNRMFLFFFMLGGGMIQGQEEAEGEFSGSEALPGSFGTEQVWGLLDPPQLKDVCESYFEVGESNGAEPYVFTEADRAAPFGIEETNKSVEHASPDHKFKHSVAVMLGHSHIDEGRDAEGNAEWITVASFAIDYNYHITNKWSVGLHNDIILETFFIERVYSFGVEEEFLERKFPLASVAVVGYKVLPFLTASAGFGGEFAPGENFAMIRVGVEAGFHLNDPSWELVTGINYDARFDAYDIWNLTAGVAKRF